MELKLTIQQNELLFDVAESHLQWYKLYYEDPPKFEILLELNHTKLSYLIDEHTTEQDITDALIKMKAGYDTLIEDYGPHNNNYE
jgi:hypothetical protein